MLGVKAIRAFDSMVIIVSLSARSGRPCGDLSVRSQRKRTRTGRGAGSAERDEPYHGQLLLDTVNMHAIRWLCSVVVVLTAACASGRGGNASLGGAVGAPVAGPATPPATREGVDSMGAAVASTGSKRPRTRPLSTACMQPDAAGDRWRPRCPPCPPKWWSAKPHAIVRRRPAVREITFDIDVTSFAAHRRVLEYLHFFQVDARDRFAIWLSRLGRYEGMIRARLRAKGLPEDLVYLTLIESGLSNTAVSRAKAVGMWQFMASTGRDVRPDHRSVGG